MRLIVFWVLIPAIVITTIVTLVKRSSRSSQSTAVDSAATDNAAQPAGNEAGGATMKFQTFTLQDDPSCIGGEVSRMLIPVGWKTQGGMAYNFSSFYPAQVNLRIYDPNSSAAFSIYPSSYFIWGDFPGFPPGSNYGGSIVGQPVQDPFQAIEQIVIPQFRPDLANAAVVETEMLPKMVDAAAAALPAAPGTQPQIQAGRVRVEYTADGTPIQEDFFAVLRVDVSAGFEMWDIDQVVSVRAEKGKLDNVKKLHEMTMRSIKPSLPWFNKYFQFLSWRQQNTMAAIQSAGDFSRQIAQESDEIGDSIRQQYENQQAVNDQISEARSETMRGETPWDAGDGDKVLLPADYGRAWRDGNGQFLVSNDSSYDPNTDPNNTHITWTPMEQLQH